MKLEMKHLQMEKSELLISGKKLTHLRNNSIRTIRRSEKTLKALEENVGFMQKTQDTLRLEADAVKASSIDMSTLLERKRLSKDIAQFSMRIAANVSVAHLFCFKSNTVWAIYLPVNTLKHVSALDVGFK